MAAKGGLRVVASLADAFWPSLDPPAAALGDPGVEAYWRQSSGDTAEVPTKVSDAACCGAAPASVQPWQCQPELFAQGNTYV